MEQEYVFKDWTSASRMCNVVDCNLKIEVDVIIKNEEVRGYSITVYNKVNQRIVYKFFVDYGDEENVWSFTTKEAIEVLNIIGFPCKYDEYSFKCSQKVRDILVSLKGLGYTHIRKVGNVNFKTGDVLGRIYVTGSNSFANADEKRLEDVINEKDNLTYNFHDYWFLDVGCFSIDSILNNTFQEESN